MDVDPLVFGALHLDARGSALAGDEGGAVGYDEAIDAQATPRHPYAKIIDTVTELGIATLRSRRSAIEQEQRDEDITFRVNGQQDRRVFPVDLIPRLIAADEWRALSLGLMQRACALNAFLCDVYSEQSIVREGILDRHTLERAPRFRSTGRLVSGAVRVHVSGTDLVCDRERHWMVLEDNLRVPSGMAYALANRKLLDRHLPEFNRPATTLDVDGAPRMLYDTLCASAPRAAPVHPAVVLLSTGPADSAWFEHTFLAEQMNVALAHPSELSVHDSIVWRHFGRTRSRVDVLYLRIDEDVLLSAYGYNRKPLRSGLLSALAAGTLTVANAFGNGIADDKAIYRHVPAMIEYYLGEEPLLPQVRTWICARHDECDYVLSNLEGLVTKPVDGFGGAGVVIGPEASERAIERRKRELHLQPERFVAQEVVQLATQPTFDGDGLSPRRVDLRTFVHLRPRADGSIVAQVAPAALTRVATHGSSIVNSSSGGGSKDTWIEKWPLDVGPKDR
ncbi:circularly permuted type 2 ATP-grasp protein [Mycolicibacterium gadium]|uniref:circularly permuted type 2 ATP-grasp protein n=1 Tax=Mycolicibacterium gadium TaxID=1794 RepID=UPI002FDE6724